MAVEARQQVQETQCVITTNEALERARRQEFEDRERLERFLNEN